MSQITISIANGPRVPGVATDPFIALNKALSQPIAVRPRILSSLPGQDGSTGDGMKFIQNLTATQISELVKVAADAGSILDFYIGVQDIPLLADGRIDAVAVGKELRKYIPRTDPGKVWIGLDNTGAFDEGEPPAVLAETVLKMGACVWLEANGDRAYIRRLLAKYKGRVGVMAAWWMWQRAEEGQPGLLTLAEVKALGGRTCVLVTFPNAPGTPKPPKSEWDDIKMREARKYAALSTVDEVCVRLSTLSAAQVNELAGMNG